MSQMLVVVILLLLLVSFACIFIVYKAYFYRKNYVSAWSASKEWVLKFNKSLSESSNQKDKIVLLGASITEDWELSKYFENSPFINMGIKGQFSGQYLLRFKRDVIDLKPKAVVIKLCAINITRDIPFEVSRDNVLMMTQLAVANGIKPVLASIIPVTKEFDIKRSSKDITEEIKQFNSWLKNYAGKSGFEYLDYAKAMSDEMGYLKNAVSRDGLHPNEKGYEIMVSVLSQLIVEEEKDSK
ncbi:acylhydrolase [candidate division KSB1 bacterium]|nr:acylhydrolase [candidate division KSB1 bacterium]